MTEREILAGGREDIVRVGHTVVRPSGAWTASVHRLLAHVRASGLDAVPEPLGFDAGGREVVSYLDGTVHGDVSGEAGTDEVLLSAARLLRRYHDAAQGFDFDGRSWMLPSRLPAEIVCHGDFAPYNVVLRHGEACGIIDFDAAHPGPLLWDIAYGVYRWAPFEACVDDDPSVTLERRVARGRMFCEAYGLEKPARRELPMLMAERLDALVDFMRDRAGAGDETFIAHIANGHADAYVRDRDRILARAAEIGRGLAQ